MPRTHSKRFFSVILSVVSCVLVLGGGLVYGYMQLNARLLALSLEIDHLKDELTLTKDSLSGKTLILAQGLSDLDEKATGISDTLSGAEEKIEATNENIETVQTRVGGFEQKVGQISGTVNTLEKLSKTDPELLQKYSKIFFLNEHYAPERLSEIAPVYLYTERVSQTLHASVYPKLKALLDAAKGEGTTLYIKSAYRSFEEQSAIKSAYTVTYGAGTANQFSADQGYSEHQLGTTVDFITTGLGGQLEGFDKTAAYQWLLRNAHKYGFVLSYHEGNGYYIFEPWHWRYVGVEFATYLNSAGKHFYDLDQREIDTYLVKIFD